MTLKVGIEKNDTGLYSIYSVDNNTGWGFGGYGYSIEEAMQDLKVCIEEMREIAKEGNKAFPDSIQIEVVEQDI